MTSIDLDQVRAVLLGLDRDLQRVSHRRDELAELVATLAEGVTTLTTNVTTLTTSVTTVAGRTDLALADVEALTEWMQVLNQGIATTQKPLRCGPPSGWPLLTVRADNHQGGAGDATH
jgi:hypothetical protein